MCSHQTTVIVDGIETCRHCGQCRRTNGAVDPNERENGEWMTRFRYELEALINQHSMDSESDTPDFILADFLDAQLDIFDYTVRRRDEWHNGAKKEAEC